MKQIIRAGYRITLFFVILAATLQASETDWTLAKDKKDIRIFTRNHEGVAVREFKGQLYTRASTASIVTLLTDRNSCMKWRFKCMDYQELGSDYIYSRMDLPWPLKDRYVLLRESVTTATNGDLTIQIQRQAEDTLPASVRNTIPDHDGLVEMTSHDGYWSVTSATNTRVITYQMRVDPGGNVPKGLANAGVTKNPLQTLQALQDLLNRSEQQ